MIPKGQHGGAAYETGHGVYRECQIYLSFNNTATIVTLAFLSRGYFRGTNTRNFQKWIFSIN